MVLPALRSRGEELDGAEGERMLVEHLPHDFADRTGRADHRNAWQHLTVPFISENGWAGFTPIKYPERRDVRQDAVACGAGNG